MIRLDNGLCIEGGVYSLARQQTPQYIAQGYGPTEIQYNGDFADFNKAGMFVGDGLGKTRAPWVASQIAVNRSAGRALALRIPEMDVDEARDVVEGDVLPFVDEELGRYINAHPEFESASTLEAWFVARNGLVGVGAGDSWSWGYRLRRNPEVFPITREQQYDDGITNTFAGKGRRLRDQVMVVSSTGQALPSDLTHDEIVVIRDLRPGDTIFSMTDGITGSSDPRRASRFPLDAQHLKGNIMPRFTPQQAAYNLVTLPHRLEQSNLMVDSGEGLVFYVPPEDDATAGVLRVVRPE